MIRLVIVDDQDLIRDGLCSILDRHDDLEVVGMAADGAEAPSGWSGGAPDVVLMDIWMPGISGVEATRQVVTTTSSVRVIMLTTFDEDDLVVDAIRAGASGYLLKDIPGSTLWRRSAPWPTAISGWRPR